MSEQLGAVDLLGRLGGSVVGVGGVGGVGPRVSVPPHHRSPAALSVSMVFVCT